MLLKTGREGMLHTRWRRTWDENCSKPLWRSFVAFIDPRLFMDRVHGSRSWTCLCSPSLERPGFCLSAELLFGREFVARARVEYHFFPLQKTRWTKQTWHCTRDWSKTRKIALAYTASILIHSAKYRPWQLFSLRLVGQHYVRSYVAVYT